VAWPCDTLGVEETAFAYDEGVVAVVGGDGGVVWELVGLDGRGGNLLARAER